MNNINYNTLAQKIIETIEKVDKNKTFNQIIKGHYSDALNESIITYKYYIRDKISAEAAEILNIRPIFVEIFREIEDTDRDDAFKYISQTIRTHYNSAKRKERYKRQKAKAEGKEYKSELVEFKNVDDDAELVEDTDKKTPIKPEINMDVSENESITLDDINIHEKYNIEKYETSDEMQDNNKSISDFSVPNGNIKSNDDVISSENLDVYDLLNKKKVERIGELKQQIKEEDKKTPQNDISSFTIDKKDKQIKPETPKKTQPIVPDEPIQEEIYEYPDKVEKIDGYNYNFKYRQDNKFTIYKLVINGNTQMKSIDPFIPTVISNVSYTRPMRLKQSNADIEHKQINKWQIQLLIATNENITNTIEKLKGYKMLSSAVFNFKIIYKVTNRDELFIIKK